MPTRSRHHTAVKSGHAECWPLGLPTGCHLVHQGRMQSPGGGAFSGKLGWCQSKRQTFPFLLLNSENGFAAVGATASGGQDALEGQKEGLEAGKGCEL